MIKIYLSINSGEEVMLLPVTPEEYEIEDKWDNKEIEGLYQTLNIIGNRGLSTIELSSFFPVRDYPFLLNREMWGAEYVETIKRWQERRIPLRLTIVNTDKSMNFDTVNIPVTIDSFKHRTAKDGDIYYTLSLKEFKFIKVV